MKKLMLVFAALLLVSMTGLAQGPEALPFTVLCEVGAAGGLTMNAGQDLEVHVLAPGQTVELVPDPLNDAFYDNGVNTAFTTIAGASLPATMDLTGDPNTLVQVSFAMPSVLYADGVAGAVTVRYNGTSGAWTDAAAANARYFNPATGFQGMLDENGEGIHINIGGIFTVTAGSGPGEYAGTAVATAAYVTNM